MPFFVGLLHFGLGVNAQGIGNPVDVVEIRDDFDGVENVAVAQAVLAQRLKMPRLQCPRSARHHLRKSAQSLLARSKVGAIVVVLDVFGQLRIVRFSTEILPVSFDSIETVVGPGSHCGQHFTFGPRKARGAKHGDAIHFHGGL